MIYLSQHKLCPLNIKYVKNNSYNLLALADKLSNCIKALLCITYTQDTDTFDDKTNCSLVFQSVPHIA